MNPTNESIGRYTKRPVTIEAMQLIANPSDQYVDDMHAFLAGCDWSSDQDGIDIETLEGTMHASEGDWIIKGIKGEFYPCKPDIFEATYARELDRQAPVDMDRLCAVFDEAYEREWGRAADSAEDRDSAIKGPADAHATREAIKAILVAVAPKPPAQEQGESVDGEMFICYLIDKCEREVISEESLHGWLADFLKNPQYHKPLTRAAGAEDARDAVWPVTWKQQGSYREVIQETLKWNGVPCFVTGRVWTHNNNWPLIDAAIASQAQEGEK